MYILFDIGGTKTRVAATKDCADFGEAVKIDTPQGFDDGVEAVARIATELAGGKRIMGIAGGIRGPLNADHSGILSDSVLVDWVRKSLVHELGERLDAPVHLENDAAVAALGEAHFGAGKGYSIVAYHTVSTGVGGARVEDGAIDHAHIGFEPGKQLIDADRTLCPDCVDGTLENMISGSSLAHRFKKKAYEVPQDDPVWDTLALWLSYGLKNTISYWSPDVIVLGGSMILGDPRIFLEDIIRHTKETVGESVPVPDIKDALLGDTAGLYGAMALLSAKAETGA